MSIFTFTDSYLIVLSNLHTNHKKHLFASICILHLYATLVNKQSVDILPCDVTVRPEHDPTLSMKQYEFLALLALDTSTNHPYTFLKYKRISESNEQEKYTFLQG